MSALFNRTVCLKTHDTCSHHEDATAQQSRLETDAHSPRSYLVWIWQTYSFNKGSTLPYGVTVTITSHVCRFCLLL